MAGLVHRINGLLKEGGSSRRDAIERVVVDKLGGYVDAVYFGFGEHDIYVIADVPDAETAAAVTLTVAASGAATVRATMLLAPEEMDRAVKKSVDYRPPGA